MLPLVTVAVPVCGTATPLLQECLMSICTQDFPQLEILIIDDNETRAEQKSCSSFIKTLIKQNKALEHAKHFKYICHEGNRGLVEARRTSFECAEGSYLLMVDSDDTLSSSHAVSLLYSTAEAHGWPDIVEFGATITGGDDATLAEKRKTLARTESPVVQTIFSGEQDLSSSFFCKNGLSLFVWGKLLKKEMVLAAYEHLPNMYCVLKEDLLLSYFISREAHSYVGIADKLYTYRIDTGISSAQKIIDMDRWQKLCSASSVFTAIAYDMDERPFAEESPVPEAIRTLYFDCITRNAYQLVHYVDASIFQEARAAFIEAWGEESALKAIEAVANMNQA